MEKNNHSKRIQFGRFSYSLLAIIFAVCIVTQIFLAGLATFVHPMNWAKHSTLVHIFGFNIPIFMLFTAFIGSMPRWAYYQIGGLLGLIFAMYLTANFTAIVPWIAAAHPVIAMLLFVLAFIIVLKTWRLVFNQNKKLKGEN
jgi:hypothetical protein